MSQNHMGRLGLAALLGTVSGPVVQLLPLSFELPGAVIATSLPLLAGYLLARGVTSPRRREWYPFVYGVAGGCGGVLFWQLTLDPMELRGLSGALAWLYSTTAALGLWIFAAVGTFIRRRRPAPANPGICRHCGYDLTGNVSGRCPECGRAVNLV